MTTTSPALTAPFPWFGGKRKVAAEVWSRFGRVENYVEPFFGSGAVVCGCTYDARVLACVSVVGGRGVRGTS
jgi:site-specific DNA-adenine methylase